MFTTLTASLCGRDERFLSALQRLRQLGATGDSLTDFYEIEIVGYSTIFAGGVIGASFAGVLYLLFRAGLLAGNLFPDFNKQDASTFPKLIVWAFLAGFIERLVPDTLNRLLAKNSDQEH